MRYVRRPCWTILLLLLLPATLPANLFGQPNSIEAQVWDIKGSATYSIAAEPPKRLNPGTVLPPGALIQTAKGSAVDIRLNPDAGVVRMTENSVLALDKLAATSTAAGNTVEVQMNLRAGNMLGNVPKLLAGSRYHVKVSNGMVGVRDGQFRISAQGFVVLLSGALAVVHVPAVGEPAPHTLMAPPAVYFSPLENVKPAPPPLAQEVQNQLNARLRVP